MAIFKNIPEEWQDLDWEILSNGPISAYWRSELLDEDIKWLSDHKYQSADFNCSEWTSEEKMHEDLSNKLKLPDYYGCNYDALDECMRDFNITDAGLVIVLRHFDLLNKEKKRILVGIFGRASRFHSLLGNRFITLIQVDDPDALFPSVEFSIEWNRREWLNANRKNK